MPVGSTTTSAIQSLDTSVRALFRRARAAGPDFADVLVVVKGLHTVLKHLKDEAEDPDSLLNANQQDGSVYARQLTPVIEDCDFTLKQLDTILEKYDGHHDDTPSSGLDGSQGDGSDGRHVKDKLSLIRTKLANQKLHIDMFLDTIQLHNPAHNVIPLPPPDTAEGQMDDIKDKVDMIAERLFQRQRAPGYDSDEALWQQFCSELVKEGFSAEVLHRHKEVLRAYIRELDERDDEGNRPPTVRQLLPGPPAGPPVTVTPASHRLGAAGETSPKEMFPNWENEKFSLDVKNARPVPAAPSNDRYTPYPSGTPQPPYQHVAQLQPQGSYSSHLVPQGSSFSSNRSYQDRYSSDSDSSCSSDGEFDDVDSRQMALISTRDLINFDRNEKELMLTRMGALHLSPHAPPPQYASPGTSPNTRYLPAPSTPLSLPAPGSDPGYTGSTSPVSQALSASPRYVPVPPTYSALSPPPAYASPAGSAHPLSSSFPSMVQHPAMQGYRPLAPDSRGREIPPDAKWTKINRKLVSPEVLERAGVRYEARPNFVAVLGELTREEISEFARRSEAVRRSRYGARRDKKRSTESSNRGRTGSTSDSETKLWDDSDSSNEEKCGRRGYDKDQYVPKSRHREKENGASDEKGTKVYPFIVSPPSNEGKASPASTVQPKPILKNTNTHQVRFEKGAPVEITAEEAAAEKHARSYEKDRERRRNRADSSRDHDRDHDRGDRDRERRRRRDRERDDGHRERDRERDRDRDREGGGDRDRYRGDRGGDHGTTSHRRHHHGREPRDAPRERRGGGGGDATRDERAQADRAAKKSALRETLGAVGIGGAAASLLSVLSEAAAGF